MEAWGDVGRKVELSGPLAQAGAVAGSSGEGEPSKWVERHENRHRGALVTWPWAVGRPKAGLGQLGHLGCSERHAHLPPAHPSGLRGLPEATTLPGAHLVLCQPLSAFYCHSHASCVAARPRAL